MRKHSRRFADLLKKVEPGKYYSSYEALKILQKLSNTNFIETLEAHIVLGLDPKYADQQLRATVVLPEGTGKSIKVAVITKPDQQDEAYPEQI